MVNNNQNKNTDKTIPLKVSGRPLRPADNHISSESDETQELFEKVIQINRTSKVVKGGRRIAFSALVAVGDTRGNVGYGLGKAKGVAEAIHKGIKKAKRETFKVPFKDTTIPHKVIGKEGATRVLLKPASPGTGIIAGSPVRAICEAAGIKDILTKCLKSGNAINVVKATADGLRHLRLNSLRDEDEAE